MTSGGDGSWLQGRRRDWQGVTETSTETWIQHRLPRPTGPPRVPWQRDDLAGGLCPGGASGPRWGAAGETVSAPFGKSGCLPHLRVCLWLDRAGRTRRNRRMRGHEEGKEGREAEVKGTRVVGKTGETTERYEKTRCMVEEKER